MEKVKVTTFVSKNIIMTYKLLTEAYIDYTINLNVLIFWIYLFLSLFFLKNK